MKQLKNMELDNSTITRRQGKWNEQDVYLLRLIYDGTTDSLRHAAHFLKRSYKSTYCKALRMGIIVASQRVLYRGYRQISGSYMSNLRYKAKEKGLPFEITPEYIWKRYLRQGRKCAISGVSIDFNRDRHKPGEEQTASVDRIDPNKGYVKGNIQIVHKDINLMKMGLQQERLIELCRKVANANPPKSKNS